MTPTGYRMSKDPSKSCQTCANYNPLISACNKFVTYVDANAVCDHWAMKAGSTKISSGVKKIAMQLALGWMTYKNAQAAVAPETVAQASTSSQPPEQVPVSDELARMNNANTGENQRLVNQQARTSTEQQSQTSRIKRK